MFLLERANEDIRFVGLQYEPSAVEELEDQGRVREVGGIDLVG